MQELLSSDNSALDYWLAKFIFEVVRQNGTPYRRDNLVSIVAGLNSFFTTNKRYLNLFKDDAFHHFREVLDTACKNSSKAGTSCSTRKAEVISESEEEIMWSQKVLGDKDPETLIQTLLYLNGLRFALKSSQEHRSLTTEQLKVIPPNCNSKYYVIEYTEAVSKTNNANNGGLKHRKLDPKKVRHVDTIQTQWKIHQDRMHCFSKSTWKKDQQIRQMHGSNWPEIPKLDYGKKELNLNNLCKRVHGYG